ncbi:MAG: glycosyltransferase family 39 protein [Candidatus Auribacterota bacterium]
MTIKKEFAFILLIVVGACVLFFAGITSHNLWLDEAYSLSVASKSFSDLFTVVARQDPHPPLYYMLLRAWMLVFGMSLTPALVLSVIFGLATGLCGMYLYRILFGRGSICAGILIFSSPFFLLFSRMVRYYSFAAFLVCLLLIFLTKYLQTQSWRWWFALLAAHIAVLYSDYPASTLFLCEIPCIALFWRTHKRQVYGIIAIFIITALSFVPWLDDLWYHIHQVQSVPQKALLSHSFAGGAVRLAFTFYDFICGETVFPWEWAIIVPLCVIFISAAAVAIRNLADCRNESHIPVIIGLIAVSSLLTAVTMANVLAQKQSFVYMPSRLMFCFVPIMVFAAYGINNFRRMKGYSVAVVVCVNMISLMNVYTYQNFINPLYTVNWRDAADTITQQAKAGDYIICDEPEPLMYYLKRTKPKAEFCFDEKELFTALSREDVPPTIRLFVSFTSRDSTGSSFLSKHLIEYLMDNGRVMFFQDYGVLNERYINLKKRLYGKAYPAKMHLFLVELQTDAVIHYFRENNNRIISALYPSSEYK